MKNFASLSERRLGGLCHLLGILGFIPPLIIWLVKKGESEYVCAEAREVLNLQIHYVVLMAVLLLVWPTPNPLPGLVLFVIYALLLTTGGILAWRGAALRYPLLIRPLR